MATMRVNLTDGTTTVTLYEGEDSTLREAGLSITAPNMRTTYIASPFADAEMLTIAKYSNRKITLKLKIKGTSLADLKTNIRTINRLLTDGLSYQMATYPKHGTLTSSGRVYLELQWGDVANESTYYEVVRGALEMPAEWYNFRLIYTYAVIDAVLNLEVKPFGLYTPQDVAAATVYNYDIPASTSHNYIDVSTAEVYGDVAARFYMTLAPTGATGSTNTYIARRSGARRTDNLWTEGEATTGALTVVSAGTLGSVSSSVIADAAYSAGNYERVRFTTNSSGGYPTTEYFAHYDYTVSTPPRGAFRVLTRMRTVGSVQIPYTNMLTGVGYTYGGVSHIPASSNNELFGNTADSATETLDLGLIVIPPIAESDIATNNSLTLQLWQYAYNTTGSITTADHDFIYDYLFMLPVDEGAVIVKTTGSTDTIAVDNITEPNNVFKLDGATTAVITGYPDYVGAPFPLGRESTRLYVIRNDTVTTTHSVAVKYMPQFLTI